MLTPQIIMRYLSVTRDSPIMSEYSRDNFGSHGYSIFKGSAIAIVLLANQPAQ